jgi:hypothetical protein
MDLKGSSVGWIQLVQDRVQWQVVVNVVIKLSVP